MSATSLPPAIGAGEVPGRRADESLHFAQAEELAAGDNRLSLVDLRAHTRRVGEVHLRQSFKGVSQLASEGVNGHGGQSCESGEWWMANGQR